jgi:Multicopper oxidase
MGHTGAPEAPKPPAGHSRSSPPGHSEGSPASHLERPRTTGARGEDAYWREVEGAEPSVGGRLRRYYLQAEEVEWSYAPEGYNLITGLPFTASEAMFASAHIGSTYVKCLYFQCAPTLASACNKSLHSQCPAHNFMRLKCRAHRGAFNAQRTHHELASAACPPRSGPHAHPANEAASGQEAFAGHEELRRSGLCVHACRFAERVTGRGTRMTGLQCLIMVVFTDLALRRYTDDTFSERVLRAPYDEYLGFLGPVLHAEVGDDMHVLFSNQCSFPATFHVHGLHYDKGHEGAPSDDGTPRHLMKDDSVAPGSSHVYKCAPQLPACCSRSIFSLCFFFLVNFAPRLLLTVCVNSLPVCVMRASICAPFV